MKSTPKIVLRRKTYIELHVRPNTSVEKRHEIMKNWYRVQLKSLIPTLIMKWEKIMDLKVESKTNEDKVGILQY
jgi:hypothetical protein